MASEPSPSGAFDSSDVKGLLRRQVTSESELDRIAELVQPDECKKELEKELRSLDTQSTLQLPGGRTQSTLELNEEPGGRLCSHRASSISNDFPIDALFYTTTRTLQDEAPPQLPPVQEDRRHI